MIRRRELATLGAALAPLPLHAQGYPARAIRMIVGFPAGDAVDVTARILADALQKPLGQRVVVENVSGANGVIALDRLTQAEPDGYTLSFISVATLVALHFQNRPLDARRMFTPVACVNESALVLVVNPKLVPVTSFTELLGYLRAHPGTSYTGAAGIGSQGQLFMESLAHRLGLTIDFVPNSDAAAAMSSVVGGRIGVMIADMTTAPPQVAAGAIVPLVVSAGDRVASFPDVPSIAEVGLGGYATRALGGIIAPPRLPTDLNLRLTRAIEAVLDEPAVQQRLHATGYEARYLGPVAFLERLVAAHRHWGEVIAQTGIRAPS